MDDFFIYEHRLASFFHGPQTVLKPMTSSAPQSRCSKTLSWPHKSIKPADMAKAGFVFRPLPGSPDNVFCFLCHKALDGWEDDDIPLGEHLRHSPECGWAITAAIEVELGQYATEDPRDGLMVEARKATFAGRWPYEGRKGWSCKIKQLVEAGWKYTPTLDSDDSATCTYCLLALDGWEKGDKPWDEHYSRVPGCPFFNLISSKPAPQKPGRSKAARCSKASRLSLQSVTAAVTLSDNANSVADPTTADDVDDDSVLTTASAMTTASRKSKKASGGKKAATTARTRNARAKEEAVQVHQDIPDTGTTLSSAPPKKPMQGRKRTSAEMDDCGLTDAEAPVTKKRAVKTGKARDSNATEVSWADTETMDELGSAKKPAARKAVAKKKTTTTTKRKVSTIRKTRNVSSVSTASAVPEPAAVPDHDTLDRQLQADLERPLTDDEGIPADPHPRTRTAASRQSQGNGHNSTQRELTDFAMFDPAPVEPTDAQIDADLRWMESEMSVDHVTDMGEVQLPDNECISGAGKVSKKTAGKKVMDSAAPVEQPQVQETAEAEQPDELTEADISFGSTGTVVRKSAQGTYNNSLASTRSNKKAGKCGQPAKSWPSETTVDNGSVLPTAPEPAAEDPPPELMEVDAESTGSPVAETATRGDHGRGGRLPKKSKASDSALDKPSASAEAATEAESMMLAEVQVGGGTFDDSATAHQSLTAAATSPKIARKPVPVPKDSPPMVTHNDDVLAPPSPPSRLPIVAPRTPGHHVLSSMQSAKQANISPSPSPQASDEENRPPSSKPKPASAKVKRVLVAAPPVVDTPMRQTSPSKQDMTGELQSSEPWTAVDLNLVFAEFYPDPEDGDGPTDGFLVEGGGDLTERERDMTVEAWIYYNASQAEQKLRHGCERMVMAFEREGTRALRALEGLVVYD